MVVVGGGLQMKTVQNNDLDWLWLWRASDMPRGTPNDAKQPKTVVLGLFMCHRTTLEDRAHYEQHGSRCCVVVVCFVLPGVAPDPPGSWGHACRVAAA